MFALVLLGMHRSGTSALGGLLARYGVDFGPALMPPNSNVNAKGFYEDIDVVRLHDEVFGALSRRWDDPRLLPEEWRSMPRVVLLGDSLLTLIQQRYAGRPLWGLKDPRMCRLTGLWEPIWKNLGCEPRFCLPFRNPMEVVRSLQNRTSMHSRFSDEKSGVLYLLHVLESERATRGSPRVAVNYDSVLANPADTAERVLRDLGLEDFENRDGSKDLFLEERLRHHRMDDPVDGYPNHWSRPLLEAVWKEMRVLEKTPDNATAMDTMDEVAKELILRLADPDVALTDHLECVVDEFNASRNWSLEVHGAAGARERLINELREQLGELRSERPQIEALAESANILVRLEKRKQGEEDSEKIQQAVRIKRLEDELAVARSEARNARVALDRMMATRSWKLTAPLRALDRGRASRLLSVRSQESCSSATGSPETAKRAAEVASVPNVEAQREEGGGARISSITKELTSTLKGPSSDGQVAYFTICSKNFLAYARTLFESLRAVEPGARCWVALCDRIDGLVDFEEEEFEVLELVDLSIPDVEEMAARYNITEFNTAIKPFAFQALFQLGFSRVVYFDPDIYVCSALEEVDNAFEGGAEACLTPHTVEPIEEGWFNDSQFLKYGVFNLGFVALRSTPRVHEILGWWARRLQHHCIIDLANGIFVDQKWVDLFPAFLNRVEVIRHPGYNVAYWNVPRRSVRLVDGRYLVNGLPLRFAHFSGNRLDDENCFTRHNPEVTLNRVGALRDLLAVYRQRVFANEHAKYRALPYAFSWGGASGRNEHTPQEDGVGS